MGKKFYLWLFYEFFRSLIAALIVGDWLAYIFVAFVGIRALYFIGISKHNSLHIVDIIVLIQFVVHGIRSISGY